MGLRFLEAILPEIEKQLAGAVRDASVRLSSGARVVTRRADGARRALAELATPALLVDAAALEHNLATMSAALPGARLRPHVKAHKCTALARRQAAIGHRGFTCATIREIEGMAAAGLGDDLLLANEVLDARRLGRLDARVTVAVDSEPTLDAAARGGVREVLVDVNVGLPRCGCAPEAAGRLADRARARGLSVRGVMGYEGHLMLQRDAAERERGVAAAMELLLAAHRDVGGEVVSAGGTGTYAQNRAATEIQAGSYALMDTAYATLELPFRPALEPARARDLRVGGVRGRRLRAQGARHGPRQSRRSTGARVWFCSDEHVTFAPEQPRPPGRPRPRRAGSRRPDGRLPRADPPRVGRGGGRHLADRPAGLVAGSAPGARTADRGSMTDPKPVPLLGRLAVHLKMISMDQLAEAVRAQGRAGEDAKLGEILVERGFIDRSQLAKLIAAQQQVIAKQKAEGGARARRPRPAPGGARRRKPAPSRAPAPTARAAGAARADARAAPAPTPRPPRARSRSEARPISPRRPTPTARASKRSCAGRSSAARATCICTRARPCGSASRAGSRRDGDAPLDPEAAERMVLSFLGAAQREALAERGELDFCHTFAGHRPLPREPLPPPARPRRRVPLHLGDAADARAARPAGAAREVHDLPPGHGAGHRARRAAASRRRWPRS